MYLSKLVEFAENNAELLPPIGYALKKCHWMAVIQEDLSINFQKSNESMLITYIDRSSGISPFLITDKAAYVLGLEQENANPKQKKRAIDCYSAYYDLLVECYEETNSSSVHKIIAALDKKDWELPEEMKVGDNIVFRLHSEPNHYPHEEDSVKAFWREYITPKSDPKKNKMCIVCKQFAPPVERHSMKFFIGPDGTKLISANANAYESYGLSASEVAPTCFSCEQKYGQALLYLLRKYSEKGRNGGPHTLSIGELTYIFWSKNNKVTDLLSTVTSAEDNVRDLLFSPNAIPELNEEDDCYILTVSANKARLVVRDFTEISIWQLKEHLTRFFEAQNVGQDKRYTVYSLASCLYNNANNELQKNVIEEWMNWAFKGKRLSVHIVSKLLKRVQATGELNRLQAAALKSWLVSQQEEDWTVALDESRQDAPYLCGRLFAVIEKMQTEAIRSNDTIAGRYFSSASTTPKSIFAMLLKYSQAYLNKLRKENQAFEVYYSKIMQSILENIGDFPTLLKPNEQAIFAIGYYHQKQDLYTSKKDKEGETENEL